MLSLIALLAFTTQEGVHGCGGGGQGLPASVVFEIDDALPAKLIPPDVSLAGCWSFELDLQTLQLCLWQFLFRLSKHPFHPAIRSLRIFLDYRRWLRGLFELFNSGSSLAHASLALSVLSLAVLRFQIRNALFEFVYLDNPSLSGDGAHYRGRLVRRQILVCQRCNTVRP